MYNPKSVGELCNPLIRSPFTPLVSLVVCVRAINSSTFGFYVLVAVPFACLFDEETRKRGESEGLCDDDARQPRRNREGRRKMQQFVAQLEADRTLALGPVAGANSARLRRKAILSVASHLAFQLISARFMKVTQ
jgi:hypothetical protein